MEEALIFLNGAVSEGLVKDSLKPGTLCAANNIDLKNVQGQDIQVRVQVVVGALSDKGTATLGEYDPNKKVVRIFVSPWAEKEDLTKRKHDLINSAASVLKHEVTHALDYLGNMKVQEFGEAYYNSPHEIKAFARQIVEESRIALKVLKLKSLGKPLPSGAALVEAVLKGSATWNKINKDLNDRNLRYVRQVLVRELDL